MKRQVILMRKSLAEVPGQAVLSPPGIRRVPFVPECYSVPARALMNNAYRFGGGQVEGHEDWWPRLQVDAEYDPELCWIVLDERDNQVVGFAQCWTSAFVKDIVVAEPWRRRGLGKWLMFEIFQTFKSRGADKVMLKVESDNPHGATIFYQSIGMEEVSRFVV